MTKIKSFEDACKVLQLDPTKVLPDFSMFPEKHQKAMTAHAKLIIIAEAINFVENDNKPWSPDWTNGQWDKYYPWFDMDDSSAPSCFSYFDCVFWLSNSNVGSRLCFISSEAARYAGKQFIGLYRDYFVI